MHAALVNFNEGQSILPHACLSMELGAQWRRAELSGHLGCWSPDERPHSRMRHRKGIILLVPFVMMN